jgi:uncharacterized protein YdeI (YjbR/CyaY-like superfamily)
MTDQLAFSDREEFRQWLQENHSNSKGIWVVFTKTRADRKLRPNEALEEALCFGWIDGQIKRIDDKKYLKKFTPRAKDSRWSGTNRTLALRLVQCGRMTEHGHAAIENAKSNGNWDIPARQRISDEQVQVLVNALQGAGLALANFLKMPPSVRRVYTLAYLDARKEQTKKKRLEWIIDRLNANKPPM